MVSLDKCSGSCNSVDDLSTKIWVPVNMITNKNEPKTIAKLISCNCRCKRKFQVQLAIHIENGIMKYVIVSAKNYRSFTKDYSWNASICICENGT